MVLTYQVAHYLWTGDYWATWRGGILLGGKSVKMTNLPMYTRLGKGVSINKLSPAEKYDLYVGNKKYPLTRYERKRGTQVKKSLNGKVYAMLGASNLFASS